MARPPETLSFVFSPMNRLLSCLLLLTVCLHAEEIDVADNTIVLGQAQRVGRIKPGMKVAELENLYGKENFKLAELPGPEATMYEGAKFFEGTDRELNIAWHHEDVSQKMVGEVIIIGKAWKFENGLKEGMSPAEVEKINGKPFKVNGFGWDLGGWANFEGGKLAKQVVLYFEPKSNNYPDSVNGDHVLSSGSKTLRSVKPFVSKPITVLMR